MKILNNISKIFTSIYIIFLLIWSLMNVFMFSKFKVIDIVKYFYIIGIISIVFSTLITIIVYKKIERLKFEEYALLVLLDISLILLIIPIEINEVLSLIIISITFIIPGVILGIVLYLNYKFIKNIYVYMKYKLCIEYSDLTLIILIISINIVKIAM